MGLFSRKKRDGLNSAAHVKPSTAGTSNELSFSVLHAAKHEMDARHGEALLDDELGKIKLFSGETEVGYDIVGSPERDVESGSAASSTHHERAGSPPTAENPAAQDAFITTSAFNQEVSARRAARKKKKRRIFAATAVVVVLLLAAAGFVLAVAQRSAEFDSRLSEAVVQVFQTDDTIATINEILADPTSESSRQNTKKALSEVPTAQEKLSGVEPQLQALEDGGVWPSSKEIVAQLSQSVEGRKCMLASAETLLERVNAANAEIEIVEKSWSSVSDADTRAREAAQLVASPTEKNLTAALTDLDEAISFIGTAENTLSEVKSAAPSLDFSLYASYLQAQKLVYSEQKLAIENVIASDTSAAREHQAASEEAEKQARDLAVKIENVTQPIVDAYNNSTASLIEEYENARAQVAVADEYLRKNYG